MPISTDSESFEREARDDSRERRSSDGDRLAAIDLDEVEGEGGVPGGEDDPLVNEKDEAVTWMTLPHKGQLAVLTLSRLSEPLVQTSLQVSYATVLIPGMDAHRLDHRHTCFTNSDHSMKTSPTRRLLRRLV